MHEVLHHVYGYCGEAHLNLWHTLLAAPIVGYIAYKVKTKQSKR